MKNVLTALPPLALEGAQGNYPMIYHHRLRIHFAELRSVLRFTSEMTDQNWKMHQALWSCSIAKKQQTQVFSHFAHRTHMQWKTLDEKNTFSCVPHRKEFIVEIFEKKNNLESQCREKWVDLEGSGVKEKTIGVLKGGGKLQESSQSK